MDSSAHYVEVCDLPYCSEPKPFYEARMETGLRVRELREKACLLFEKRNDELTVRDPKLAFLKMHPIRVNLDGDNHEVTVKKLEESWILSWYCRAWVFNLSGDRRCKHTAHIENLMQKEEERWGVGR